MRGYLTSVVLAEAGGGLVVWQSSQLGTDVSMLRRLSESKGEGKSKVLCKWEIVFPAAHGLF